MDGLDKLQTDGRFELLSAYVDNELSVSERKQVEEWLESDPELRQQYHSMTMLSRAFQTMPAPQSSKSADDLLDAVFTKVERKPRMLKRAGIGTAIVAAIGALGALFSNTALSPRIAQNASEDRPEISSINTVMSTDIIPGDIKALDTDSLMLVLEAPPVDIPVVAEKTSYTDSPGL